MLLCVVKSGGRVFEEPIEVSERLGHANIAVTLDIYSKVRPALDLEAAESVARELFAN